MFRGGLISVLISSGPAADPLWETMAAGIGGTATTAMLEEPLSVLMATAASLGRRADRGARNASEFLNVDSGIRSIHCRH